MGEGLKMMKDTSKKRRNKLNRLGKLTLGLIVVFTVILTVFVTEIVADKKVEAEKGTEQAVKSKVKTNKISKEETQPKKNTPDTVEQEKAKDEESSSHKETDGSEEKSNSVEEKQKKQEEQENKETDSSKKQTSAPETGKVVYLTFDDGPHPTASKEILQLLDQYDAKATYFMLEPNMKNNTDVVQEMAEKGHAIGVHGVTHEVSKIYQSPQSFVQEMNQGIDFIHKTTGINTKLVRAPYGSNPYITPPFKEASDKEGFILWDWNIDSVDWKYKNGGFVDTIIQRSNQLVGKEPLIVLMHEKPNTARHLERLLQFYKENGYDMRAIDESMQPIQFK